MPFAGPNLFTTWDFVLCKFFVPAGVGVCSVLWSMVRTVTFACPSFVSVLPCRGARSKLSTPYVLRWSHGAVCAIFFGVEVNKDFILSRRDHHLWSVIPEPAISAAYFDTFFHVSPGCDHSVKHWRHAVFGFPYQSGPYTRTATVKIDELYLDTALIMNSPDAALQ